MEDVLEEQARRIEEVLAARGIAVRVTGGAVTPRWVRFEVFPLLDSGFARIWAMGEELAAALEVEECRVVQRETGISVDLLRDDPRPVRLVATLRRLALGGGLAPMTAVAGLTEADGTPLLVRVGRPGAAHVLVAGDKGTALLRTFALSLALATSPRTLALVLVDPLGETWGDFASLPHLARPVVRDAGEALEALESLVRLAGKRSAPAGTHVVAIVAHLDPLSEAAEILPRLVRGCHRAGVHVVVGIEDGGHVLSPCPVHLLGCRQSAGATRQVTGRTGTGAEPSSPSDFVAVFENRAVPFHAAQVSSEEVHQLVAGLALEATVRDGDPATRYAVEEQSDQLSIFRGGV